MNFAGRRVPKNDGDVPAIKHDRARAMHVRRAEALKLVMRDVARHLACIPLVVRVAVNVIERVVLTAVGPVALPLLE